MLKMVIDVYIKLNTVKVQVCYLGEHQLSISG